MRPFLLRLQQGNRRLALSIQNFRFQSSKAASTGANDSSHPQTKEKVQSIEEALSRTRKYLGYVRLDPKYSDLSAKIESLTSQHNLEELWATDSKMAISIQQNMSALRAKLDSLSAFEFNLQQCQDMKELAMEENDLDLLADVEQDSEELDKNTYNFYLKSLMSQDVDKNGCFIELRSGAGGVEACDWVEMLTRMYERWGIDQGYEVAVVDFARGEVAGYKTSTVSIKGEYAFGWAKYETGVHRFVRCSPFDSQGKRHTSFVSVQVTPSLGEESSKDDEIDIPTRDLKVEVMRSQGAGGQHVNKTESAVRLTHIPSGISAFCQNDRSQHRNKAIALEMIKSKLYAKRLAEENQEKKQLYSQQADVGWGNQIRNYVLHPYNLVKDSRSGHQTSNVQYVLDGNLQPFMQASLMHDKIQTK